MYTPGDKECGGTSGGVYRILEVVV